MQELLPWRPNLQHQGTEAGVGRQKHGCPVGVVNLWPLAARGAAAPNEEARAAWLRRGVAHALREQLSAGGSCSRRGGAGRGRRPEWKMAWGHRRAASRPTVKVEHRSRGGDAGRGCLGSDEAPKKNDFRVPTVRMRCGAARRDDAVRSCAKLRKLRVASSDKACATNRTW